MKKKSEKTARLAQSVERKALNLVVVGSSPTVGVFSFLFFSLRLEARPPARCQSSPRSPRTPSSSAIWLALLLRYI